MIQITRSLARHIRAVIKKVLPRPVAQPVLTFRAGDTGLFVEVQGSNQALQFHDPRPQDPEILFVPLNVLEDVQGPKEEPVFLNSRRTGVIGASWQNQGVFQDLEYDSPEPAADAPPFPVLPTQFAENPADLLVALREAYETTDLESKRYALGSIQIRGKDGVIAATDGRQLLKQSGFSFGFSEELLLAHTKFFGCKDLPQDQPVRTGKIEDKVAFQIGPWTHWVAVATEGRFPDVDRSIPATQYSKATLKLAPADAGYFVDNLHRLPNGETHRELTLDLNGKVILRASSLSTPRPAEMFLRNSSKQGDDIRICTDRRFLARAASMGFPEIHFPDTTAPAVATDANRTYVWMLLDPKEALKPSEDCLRLESPFSTHTSPRPRRATSLRKSTDSVPAEGSSAAQPAEHSPRVTGQATRSVPESAPKMPTAMDQAIAVRNQLRTSLGSLNELIRTMKSERRSRKSLKRAMESIRQLPNVA